jgi:hypothetical protein
MKTFNTRYIFVALTIAACVSASSCKKLLDFQSPSALNLDQTFSSVDYTNNEILGIYNKTAGRSAFGGNLPTALAQGADDFCIQASATFDPTNNNAIANYGVSPLNTAIFDTFNQMYAGIERANIACKYIPLSSLYQGNGADKKTMQRYYGEALTLRALFYYELIINWGDVPATFVPAADAPTQFMKNAPRDSTFDKILNDLKLASTLVEGRTQLPAYGDFRITKSAIKALRARIALARGGYSLRTESHIMERSADYQKYYQIAFDECNDIIQAGEHGLNPVFENIFKSLHTPQRYDDAHEMIYEVAMWGGFNDSDLARTYGAYFNASATWGNGGGGPVAVPTYFYSFQNGTDQRRDATCTTYFVGAGDLKLCNSLTGISCAKFRKSWTAFTIASTSLQFGVNWPVMRYADVLLMYAEAANELQKTGSLTALQALQLVQKRAYGNNPLPVTPGDKDGFFNAIVNERLLEFGGEGLRKYDLIRWNRLASTFADIKLKLPLLAAGSSSVPNNPYVNTPDYIYFIATPFGNKECTTEETNQNLYLGPNNSAFYTANTAVPAGFARSYWKKQLGQWTSGVYTPTDWVANPNNGYVSHFQANRAELLPYPQKVIIENRGSVVQNFGYTN